MKRSYHIVITMFVITVFILSVSILVSCEQSDNETLPNAELNYFSAAEGVFCFPGTKAIYIDEIDTSQFEPNRFTTRTLTGETFPSLYSTGGGNSSGTASILYMREASGSHRFIFTNANKQVLADTVINLTAGIKHSLYVYDDPDSLLYRCRILHLQDDTKAAANECQFRVLHFSGDLGQMNCYFILEDGSRSFQTTLPVDLTYSNYSDFITLDESVVGSDGNAYLQFYSGTDTANVKATATIPYRNGRSYAIVVGGLTNTKYLQYEDPVSGSASSVQLNASISARVRTIN